VSEREAQLEARVRQLEAMVNSLSNQVQNISNGAGAAAPTTEATTSPMPGGGRPDDPDQGGPEASGTAAPDVGTVAPSAMGGAAAPGQSLPPNPPPSPRFNSPAVYDRVRANAIFGPGFELRTNDDEYVFQFHNLTQFDYRGYEQNGQVNVRDTFAFPRQWFIFSGRISKPFGYFVSIANGFDTFAILDVFLDVDYDPRFRIRAGRFKTPFTYEFFVEPVQGLVVPERSLFFNNFALNRDLGVMPFGRLFNNHIDYAVGIFNGVRNGIVDLDNSKAVAAFLNYRPFTNDEDTLFENLNIGGSVFSGGQDHVPIPQVLRTVVPTAGNSVAGVPFLNFNNNVREDGPMAFWDLHMAWYYRQLAVIGEWGSGFQNYSTNATALNPTRTRIPVEGFYIQASYLITGETRASTGIVKPNSPFDIRKGKFGTGAWEPFFRYEYLDIGNQVFTGGLADPNLWANRVFQTHTGINWHLTQYIKMYFDWNHAEFNNPVFYAPNHRQKTSDELFVRLQLYF
jgi:phosphate-selective porin OprO/OprP